MSKQTDITRVPKLRFPEFEGDWEPKKLEALYPLIRNGFVGTATPYYAEVGIKYLQGKNIKKGQIDPTGLIYVTQEFHDWKKKSQLKKDDILMVQSGHVGECAVVTKEFSGANCHALVVMTPTIDTCSDFFVNYFYSSQGKRHIYKITTGNTIKHILTSDLKPLNLIIPNVSEQTKVASFLSAVDKKISQLERKKELLEQYKKGCMQKLFSQEIRFKDENGNNFPDWEGKRLGDVLFEHKEKSDGTETVFSVSVHKGLIDQIEHLGRSFAAANTDHYNRVNNGDIVYTKSPTGDFPLGIIKQSHHSESVIVSPLYGIFRPETYGLGYWLHTYFLSHINTSNYLNSIIQKGAKNTINITNKTFLSKALKVPVSKPEQELIGAFFSKIDDRLKLLANEIAVARTFKKGLLQQMFV